MCISRGKDEEESSVNSNYPSSLSPPWVEAKLFVFNFCEHFHKFSDCLREKIRQKIYTKIININTPDFLGELRELERTLCFFLIVGENQKIFQVPQCNNFP